MVGFELELDASKAIIVPEQQSSCARYLRSPNVSNVGVDGTHEERDYELQDWWDGTAQPP